LEICERPKQSLRGVDWRSARRCRRGRQFCYCAQYAVCRSGPRIVGLLARGYHSAYGAEQAVRRRVPRSRRALGQHSSYRRGPIGNGGSDDARLRAWRRRSRARRCGHVRVIRINPVVGIRCVGFCAPRRDPIIRMARRVWHWRGTNQSSIPSAPAGLPDVPFGGAFDWTRGNVRDRHHCDRSAGPNGELGSNGMTSPACAGHEKRLPFGGSLWFEAAVA
jgi:hypothetical protein